MKAIPLALATAASLLALACLASTSIDPADERCGAIALQAFAAQFQRENPGWSELSTVKAPPGGFSLLELEKLATRLGLEYVPVEISPETPLPVPSVAHVQPNHFVALLARGSEGVLVRDPASGTSYWQRPDSLKQRLSGRFLVPKARLAPGLKRLSPDMAMLVRGSVYTNAPYHADNLEEDCPTDEFANESKCPTDGCDECKPGNNDADDASCSSCDQTNPDHSGFAMPVWRVSEPNINLWIIDKPLFYTTSHDDLVVLKLTYKQRGPTQDTNIFGVGPNWECNWRSYLWPDPGSTNLITMIPPGGGWRGFTIPAGPSAASEDGSGTGTRLGTSGMVFSLQSPLGAERSFGRSLTNGTTNIFATLQRVDAKGRTNRFAYEVVGGNLLRLTNMIDADGLTNILRYQNTNFPHLITEVVNPFQRTNRLGYDHLGRLTNIVDMMGIASSFQYDAQGLITNLTTPYGSTRFQATTNNDITGQAVNRSLLITDPLGYRQLYVYRHKADQLNPGNSAMLLTNYYSEIPNTAPFANTFENTDLSTRNSFFWGRHQFDNLSANFQASPTNFNLLTVADYKLARSKHWFYRSQVGGPQVGDSLALLRQPSPDGSTPGDVIWYDYAGRSSSTSLDQGTNAFPRFIARVLPNGSTQFTCVERNSRRRPTQIIRSFSTGTSGVLFRTNSISYAANDIDLIAVREQPANTLVLGLGDYLDRLPRRITNALSQTTTLTYNSANRQITGITWPSLLVTTNTYFTSGAHKNCLQQTRDQHTATDFGTYQFTYSNGLARTITDPRSLQITLGWDALERLTNAAFPNGSFKLTYAANKLDLAELEDRLGNKSKFSYDALRRLERVIDPRNGTNTYSWCSCGGPEWFMDTLGRTTFYDYDKSGRLLWTQYPGGYLVNRYYDRAGRLTNVTDNAGYSVTNWLSNQGALVASSNRFGRLLSLSYDYRGRATNSVNADGVILNSTFDPLNRLLTRSYPDTGVERFFYAATGLTNHTDPWTNVTHFYYDAAGRLTNRVRLYGGASLETNRFQYNAAGDLTHLYDGESQLTRWNYDQYGRVTNKLDAASIVNFVYAYDANDRITNRLDALNRQTRLEYDPVGNLTNVVYPTVTLRYAFDALNRLTNMVDAVGTNRFSYHENGLLTAEDGPWDADTVSFDYGTSRLRSRLTLLQPSASDWVQDYAYDAARRLTNVVSPAGAFGYDYLPGVTNGLTSASRLIRKLMLPGGSYITNAFDTVGRELSTVLKNSSGLILNSHAYEYDLAGRRKKQTLTDGNYLDYTYDGLSQLQSAIGKESGGTVRLHEKFGYAYDPAGNLSKRTNNALIQTFNANNLNQLTTVTRSGTLTAAGTTTEAATSVTVNSSAATRYTDDTFARAGISLVDGNNTITAIAQDSLSRGDTNSITVKLPATVTFNYDLKGNLTNDARRIFTYDDENQLVSVIVTNSATDSTRSEFAYDGLFRRRIRKEFKWQGGAFIPTEEVRYIYDGRLPIQERNGYNIPMVAYTRGYDLSGSREGAGGIGGLLARTDQTQISPTHAYYHADGNGNVTALIDAQQRIAGRYLYDPYGNTLAMSGPLAEASTYRFSSQEFHQPSGLGLYLYRPYDPNLQRWPVRDRLGEIAGFHLYRLLRNDPLNRLDLFGLSEDTDPWGDPLLDEDEPYICSIPLEKLEKGGLEAHELQNMLRDEAIWCAVGGPVGKLIGRIGSAIGGKLASLWCKCRPAARTGLKVAPWVKDAGSFVKFAENLEKQGLPLTPKELDEFAEMARKHGVSLRADPPHAGTPWNMPHLNVGDKGVHVPFPPEWTPPNWIPRGDLPFPLN